MERSWWKFRNVFITIWLSFCFILTIVSLIIYFTADEIYRFNPEHHIRIHERVKFHTLLNYRPVDFNATWVSDDEILTQDESGNIVLYDINKALKSVLAFNTMQHMKYCTKYELSADKKYLLIAYNDDTNSTSLPTANYDVINIKTGKQMTLLDANHRPREIMSARWSPVDSSLVFVDHYDVYYVPAATKPNHVKRITFDGSEDMYNGVADWVYEEEIFGSKCAMWFSKSGTRLAYAAFNEKLVPSAHIPQYGLPETMYDQYSRIFAYRYPKVNDPNPTVELFVKTLGVNDESQPISIKPIKKFANETILYKVVWSNDDHLFVMWMNRIQNNAHLVHYHLENNNTVEIVEETEFSQENGWLQFYQSLLVNPENYIALIYRTEQDDGDTYGHVCVIQPNGELKSITSGQFEVTRLIKWDFESNYLYYTADLQDGSETKYVFRVSMDLEQHTFKPECLTCDTQCAINDAVFSEKSSYFAHICQGPRMPYVNIMKTSGASEAITSWEKNKQLRKDLENVILPGVIVITVPLDDGFEARVRLTIPREINTRSSNKYPLLIYSYGGPMVDIAMDYYKIDVNMYLSANHDIVVAEIDGRGKGGRGSKIMFANYLKLGLEVDDHIAVAKYLQNTFSYIDSDRTCIWGWSYGGYVAGMALAKDDKKIFKCGLSVAPITDWIYYNSMFTERYMGSYKENFENYRNASLIENAEGLRDKNYMIIHGMFDKNVHFQHSAMLTKELQHKGIKFIQQFYPDESNTFTNAKSHLYRTIVLYILKCFA